MLTPADGPHDPRLAEYAHVGDPAWLRARGLFVAEGRLVVRRLLAHGGFDVQSFLLTPAALRSLGGAVTPDAPVLVAGADTLEQVTGFNFHRGCLALVRRPAPLGVDDVVRGARRMLALEGVGNPDNVGGLFRVAAAFGVDGLLLDPTTADPFYRKAVRTSMGAVLRLPFARAASLPAAVARCREAGVRVIALTPDPGATDVRAASREPGARVMLVVGAEGPGLTSDTLTAADAQVRIPVDPQVDSLNVVVAAGIALSYFSG